MLDKSLKRGVVEAFCSVPFYGLSQMIGDEHSASLVKSFGGTRVSVPKTINPNNPLCKMIND